MRDSRLDGRKNEEMSGALALIVFVDHEFPSFIVFLS